jgi:Ca2+-binding RTX toxin-like protein
MKSLGLMLVALAAVAFPTAAQAAPSTAFVDTGILSVLATDKDTPHSLDVSFFGGSYTVTDTAGITPGGGCSPAGPNAVSCPEGFDILAVAVDGGAASDRIRISSLGSFPGNNDQFRTAAGLFGEGGNDTIIGSDRDDLIRGGDGDDTIDGRLGGDDMNGQRGVDTVTYASRPASQPVYVNMQQNIDGIAPPSGSFGGHEGDSPEVENLIGTPGNDTIIGFNSRGEIYDNSAANAFTGGGGNDMLVGLEGADRLLGGPGNDRLLGGAQKDKLVGAGGRDRCIGGPSKDKAKGCERKGSI